ncbi:MAG: hypothetical protein QOE34_2287 [Verrucomicrobiota bacterium]
MASNFVDGSSAYQGSIFQIAPDGTITTFATGFGANNFLEGIVLDGTGNIFVNSSNLSDPSVITGTVFKVAPDGTFTIFGTVPGQAFGVAIDSSGNVFAASASTDRTIYKFTPAGVRSVFVGPAAFAGSQGPVGLTFDSAGNLVVSTGDGPGNGEILKFAPDGTKTVFATGLTHAPRGMAYDSAGNLFVAEVSPTTSGDILKFTPGGVRTTFASGIGNPAGNGGPEYLAIKGCCGCVGPAGPAGPQGATGAAGATGATGPQGAQGTKGDTGATGAQGAQGLKGDTGVTGSQGIQGLKGDSGATGPTGSGLVSGGTLLVRQGAGAPEGFIKIGTAQFQYRDLNGKQQTVTLDVYQKP